MIPRQKVPLAGFWILLILFASAVWADTPQNGMVLPYWAVGGVRSDWHFETVLILINTNGESSSGTINVFDEDVQPFPIALNDATGLTAEFAWTVPPAASTQFLLTHPGEDVQSGWMRVKPSGKPDVELILVLRLYAGDTLVKQEGLLVPSRKNSSLPFSLASWRGTLPALPQRRWENARNPEFVALQRLAGRAARLPKQEEAQRLKNALPRPIPSRVQPNPTWLTVPALTEAGIASWYGDRFHGRRTANGEEYDLFELTAAHPTLPFGTKAKVTNLRNNLSVVVRINDRGPFVSGRAVDLSREAARKIGMIASGIALVRLEVLRPL